MSSSLVAKAQLSGARWVQVWGHFVLVCLVCHLLIAEDAFLCHNGTGGEMALIPDSFEPSGKTSQWEPMIPDPKSL